MSFRTTMSTKGQITIPKEVRERIRAKGGDRFDVSVREDGVIELRPVRRGTLEDLLGLAASLRRGPVRVTDDAIAAARTDDWKRTTEG